MYRIEFSRAARKTLSKLSKDVRLRVD